MKNAYIKLLFNVKIFHITLTYNQIIEKVSLNVRNFAFSDY